MRNYLFVMIVNYIVNLCFILVYFKVCVFNCIKNILFYFINGSKLLWCSFKDNRFFCMLIMRIIMCNKVKFK